MRQVVLLGPQRLAPTVGEVASRRGITGRAAVISAGWQEREPEDETLRGALGLPAVNLNLYARWDALSHQDPGLFAAHRERQDQLRALEDVYDGRLRHVMAGARELLPALGPAMLMDEERASAVASVRELDAHHLRRVAAIHAEWHGRIQPENHSALRQHRDEIAEALADVDVVAIAGGHIGVLLNRLRIFGIVEAIAHKHVMAWSAGAMALCERIVLFHDRPPQGAGNAEVYEHGLGVVPGIVALPHAKRRLLLNDAVRVALMARRLAPDRTVALDEHAWLAFDTDAEDPSAPIDGEDARTLCASGRVCDWRDGFAGASAGADSAMVDLVDHVDLVEATTQIGGAA